MAITLYQHQLEGQQRLLENKKYCLFFEAGTGKTFTALSALCKLPKCKVLIAAPKEVLNKVWLTDKEYDLSDYDVTYLNYEKISRDKSFINKTYDVIICDECHRLKGKSTKVSKRFQAVTKRAKYVWGLTGTPIANSYADIYNIYKHLDISEFDMNYEEFVWRYYIIRNLDVAYGYSIPMLICPKTNMLPELTERIGKHSMTKRLTDCVDMPEQQTNLVYVDDMITPMYNSVKKGILDLDGYESTLLDLVKIQKLHQAANGFIYDKQKNAVDLRVNYKFDKLNEILEDLLEETERVIIVYYFEEDLRRLKKLPYTSTTDSNDFPNKQILFRQYGASEGLNLQYCNHIIFYSYNESFIHYEQMSKRIFRIGQQRNVVYTVLISKGTIEEKIWKAIANKESEDQFLKEALSE